MRSQKVLVSIFLLVAVCVFVTNQSVSSKNNNAREIPAGIPDTAILENSTVEIASFVNSISKQNLRKSAFPAEAAEKRYETLAALIETDAAKVLRYALPNEVLLKIPSEFQGLFEKRVDIEGELEVISECDEENSRLLYFVKTGTERLPLYFSKQPDEELLTGAKIRLKGVRLGDAVVTDNTVSKDFQTTESVLSNTFGEQKVLVLLVNFQDNQTQPYTIDQANNLLFNSSNSSSVTNYYREASYGQTWITGETFGYFTLPMNTGNCDGQSQIATYAKQAATNAGININNYSKFMYVYPRMSCTYTGWGEIGGRQTWINGSLILRTTAHELGHNLGLYHSRAMDCGGTVLGSTCTTIEYGNTVDMIGASGVTGHFHAYQKDRLGWLNYGSSPSITTVQSSGNYYIAGYSPQNSGSKALKILKSTDSLGRKTWYYVEFRRPFGFDSFISNNSNLMNGVMVTMDESIGAENYLLDMTPETTSRSDAALTVNRSYTDSAIAMTITPLSVDSSGANVNISFGAIPCNMSNPTINVTPSGTQWIGSGGSANYTVTVTNNNSSNCSANGFNLQASLPSGWTSSTPTPTLNIAPGTAVTTTVQINAPSNAVEGFYALGISAVNNTAASYSATASLNCAVYASLSVTASPGKSEYTRKESASVTATVSANGSPVSGGSVAFTMTKPDGSRVTSNTTTTANGSAAFSYRFNAKKDPPGVYQVTVNAGMNGITGNGSTSFMVR
jgi:hypothetical protein